MTMGIPSFGHSLPKLVATSTRDGSATIAIKINESICKMHNKHVMRPTTAHFIVINFSCFQLNCSINSVPVILKNKTNANVCLFD